MLIRFNYFLEYFDHCLIENDDFGNNYYDEIIIFYFVYSFVSEVLKSNINRFSLVIILC